MHMRVKNLGMFKGKMSHFSTREIILWQYI